MAVNSTLRYINTDSDDTMITGLESTYPQDGATASSANGTATPSILHQGNVALPIGSLFGDDAFDHDISTPSSPVGDYIPEATDGEKVWFCSGCGDGPTGIWQSHCAACGHPRCPYCSIESTQ